MVKSSDIDRVCLTWKNGCELAFATTTSFQKTHCCIPMSSESISVQYVRRNHDRRCRTVCPTSKSLTNSSITGSCRIELPVNSTNSSALDRKARNRCSSLSSSCAREKSAGSRVIGDLKSNAAALRCSVDRLGMGIVVNS